MRSMSNFMERNGDLENLKIASMTYAWETKAMAQKNRYEKNELKNEWQR